MQQSLYYAIQNKAADIKPFATVASKELHKLSSYDLSTLLLVALL